MSDKEDVVRILYVEDEFLIQDSVESALRDAGFEPLLASSGSEAMILIERDHKRLHGLVTDVRLGSGADGWSVARRARELAPALPVVYASGGCGEEWFSRGVPLSVMVEKPFATSQIVVALSRLLNDATPSAGR